MECNVSYSTVDAITCRSSFWTKCEPYLLVFFLDHLAKAGSSLANYFKSYVKFDFVSLSPCRYIIFTSRAEMINPQRSFPCSLLSFLDGMVDQRKLWLRQYTVDIFSIAISIKHTRQITGLSGLRDSPGLTCRQHDKGKAGS